MQRTIVISNADDVIATKDAYVIEYHGTESDKDVLDTLEACLSDISCEEYLLHAILLPVQIPSTYRLNNLTELTDFFYDAEIDL